MLIHELPNPFHIAFFALAPYFLYRYYFVSPRPTLWVWCAIFVATGWGLVNAGFLWHQYWLREYVSSFNETPPEDLLQALTAGDGGRLVGNAIFGWVYALCYFLVLAVPAWGLNARFKWRVARDA